MDLRTRSGHEMNLQVIGLILIAALFALPACDSNLSDCEDPSSGVGADTVEVCDGIDNNCDGTIDEDVKVTYYRDIDSDGYGDDEDTVEGCTVPDGYTAAAGDCDDVRPTVNPGKKETCNQVDDNCDGTVDEGVTTTFYVDADQDGYGSSQTIQACSAPSDLYTALPDDCDDEQEAQNPGEQEVCDQLDNNCNSEIDEDLPLNTYYLDNDGDGQGGADTTMEDCGPAEGYVEEGTDCADDDPEVYVGADEVQNGIDSDCDGRVDIAANVYSFKFYSSGDGEPLAGVAFWFGLEGKGPLWVTDDTGILLFELESPVQDWNLAWEYSVTSQTSGYVYEYSKIYTFMGDELEKETNIALSNGQNSNEFRDIQGSISGIEVRDDSQVEIYTNSGLSDLLDATASTLPFLVEEETGGPSYLWADQTPVCAAESCTEIPTSFGLELSPADDTDLVLDRSYDQDVTMSFIGISDDADTYLYSVELTPVEDGRTIEFYSAHSDISDISNLVIPTPELTGNLADAELRVDVGFIVEGGYLWALTPWPGGSGQLEVELPQIHQHVQEEPLTLYSVPGTTIDILNDAGSDHEGLVYSDWRVDRASKTSRGTYWRVTNHDTAVPMVFPPLYEDVESWNQLESFDDQSLYAVSFVLYNSHDDLPGVLETFVYLDTESATSTGKLSRSPAPVGPAFPPAILRHHTDMSYGYKWGQDL